MGEPREACCNDRGGICAPCGKNKHHLCNGCHGCGCVTSAQHAAHVHGYPLTKKP